MEYCPNMMLSSILLGVHVLGYLGNMHAHLVVIEKNIQKSVCM